MPYLIRETNGDVRGYSDYPNPDTDRVEVSKDDVELVDWLENHAKRIAPPPSQTDPMAKLLISKGLATAKEINDEHGWSPAPPRPTRP